MTSHIATHCLTNARRASQKVVNRTREDAMETVFTFLEHSSARENNARQLCAWLVALFNHEPINMVHVKSWPYEIRGCLFSVMGIYLSDTWPNDLHHRLSELQQRFSYATT